MRDYSTWEEDGNRKMQWRGLEGQFNIIPNAISPSPGTKKKNTLSLREGEWSEHPLHHRPQHQLCTSSWSAATAPEVPANPGCQPSPVPLDLDSILAPMDPGTYHTLMPGQLLWSSFPADSHKASLLVCHSTTLTISDPASRLVPIVSDYQLILWLQALPPQFAPTYSLRPKPKNLLLFIYCSLYFILYILSTFFILWL